YASPEARKLLSTWFGTDPNSTIVGHGACNACPGASALKVVQDRVRDGTGIVRSTRHGIPRRLSTAHHTPPRDIGESSPHRPLQPLLLGAAYGDLVARIGVAHDARTGIVPQHPLEPLRRLRRAVGDDHHPGMLRKTHADAAA